MPSGIVFAFDNGVNLSPNGQKIFFCAGPAYPVGSNSHGPTDIYSCNIDGSDVVKVIDRGSNILYINAVFEEVFY